MRRFAAGPGLAAGFGACLGVILGACAPDDLSTPVVAWCEAESSGAVVALTPAADEGAWAKDGLGAPRFVELSELAVVDADGRWYGRWARPGQGPGELARPVAAAWAEDGTSVAVFDIENPRIVFVEDGTPVRPDLRLPQDVPARIVVSGSLVWAGVTEAGHALVQPTPEVERVVDESGEVMAVRSAILGAAPGQSFDTVATMTTPRLGEGRGYDEAPAPGWPILRAAVGPSNLLAVGGETARYRIRLADATGRTLRIVCRDTPALPLGDRELKAGESDEQRQQVEAAIAAAPRPDTLAPFGRFFVAHEGDLWVQRERPSALRLREAYHGVPGALYDVFDPEGRYLGAVRAPDNARLQAALGDTVWAYEVGELDETWVVAYELRWDEE